MVVPGKPCFCIIGGACNPFLLFYRLGGLACLGTGFHLDGGTKCPAPEGLIVNNGNWGDHCALWIGVHAFPWGSCTGGLFPHNVHLFLPIGLATIGFIHHGCCPAILRIQLEEYAVFGIHGRYFSGSYTDFLR